MRNGPFRTRTLCHRKMATAGMGNKKIATTLGLPQSAVKRWLQDEYIFPNCAALMEPGRKFSLILDNAPSHACRLTCKHNKTVLHDTGEFQPPRFPDLSPLRLLFVERVQNTARSASSSCRSRRIAGTFDVPSIGRGQAAVGSKRRVLIGSAARRLALPPQVFFEKNVVSYFQDSMFFDHTKTAQTEMKRCIWEAHFSNWAP